MGCALLSIIDYKAKNESATQPANSPCLLSLNALHCINQTDTIRIHNITAQWKGINTLHLNAVTALKSQKQQSFVVIFSQRLILTVHFAAAEIYKSKPLLEERSQTIVIGSLEISETGIKCSCNAMILWAGQEQESNFNLFTFNVLHF